MARGRWRRCPVTGLPAERLKRCADEAFLRPDGSFETAVRPDCDLFDVRSVAAAYGYSDSKYFRDEVLPGRPEGLTIKHENLGHGLVLYPTHTDSAEYWREHHRPKTREVSNGNLRRGPPVTDPSSGSGR